MQKTPTNLYRALTVVVFGIEVAIALFVHGGFIRHYIGDSLAVVLLYLIFRSFTRLQLAGALSLALILAFAIEVGQYFRILDVLRMGGISLVKIVAGNSFDWMDMLAYIGGAILVLMVETWRNSKSPVSM